MCTSQGPFGPARAHNRSRVSWFSHGVFGGTYITHTPPPPPLLRPPFFISSLAAAAATAGGSPVVTRDGQAPQLSGHRRFSSRVPSGSDLSVFGSQPGSRCTSCGERARRICRRSSRSLSRSSPSYASPRSPAGLPTSFPRCACLTALSPFLFCHNGFASS